MASPPIATSERARSSWGRIRRMIVVALAALFCLWQWRNASTVKDFTTSLRAALPGAPAGSTSDWATASAPGALAATLAELSKSLCGSDARIAALRNSLVQAATRLDAIIAAVEPALAAAQGVEAGALRYSLHTSAELIVDVLSSAAALLQQQQQQQEEGSSACPGAGAGPASAGSGGSSSEPAPPASGIDSQAASLSGEAAPPGELTPPDELPPYVSGLNTPSGGEQQVLGSLLQPGRATRDLWYREPPGPTAPCSAEARERQAARFAAELALRAGAGTACPPQDWVAALRDADFERGMGPQRVAVHVGANKGWLATSLIHHWTPQRGAAPETVLHYLERIVSPFMAPCGACDECAAGEAPPDTAPWKQGGAAAVPGMEVHAVEPAPANAALLRGLLRHLEPRLAGSLHVHALALANYTGAGLMPDVRPGDWRGALQPASPAPALPPPPAAASPAHEAVALPPAPGAPRPLVPVNVTTLDAFVRGVVDPARRYVLDILVADAAGGNAGVLAGARATLPFTRLLVFGYGRDGLPGEGTLRDAVQALDALGLDCYLAWGMGRLTLLRLTGCWDDRFEVWEWSSVMCLNRRDYEWRPLLAQRATWLQAPPAAGAAGEADDDDKG